MTQPGPKIERVRLDPRTGRELFALALGDLREWPGTLGLSCPNFVLFVACDASAVPDATIRAVARRSIEEGMVYLCAWGPDCERVHDLFDKVCADVAPPPDDGNVIMTTWHDDEPLAEALYFALENAHAAADYLETCRAVVAVSVGSVDWDRDIRHWMAAPVDLDREVGLSPGP
ncbi:MAG: hypothetical protein L0216_16405 [Planctomycetales bacterium]|nr:hypothetical protein [Planctomycetales bacterium]